MLPFQMVAGGRFRLATSGDIVGVNVQCQSQNPPDFVIARAIGGTTSSAFDAAKGWGGTGHAESIEWWWEKTMGNQVAKGIFQASDGGTPVSAAMTATTLNAVDAISCFDTANPPTYAALTATTTDGTTFVVTMANTGSIVVGDIVRMYAVTAMLEIAGMDFQVTAVSTNASITLGMMTSAVSGGGLTALVNGSAAQVLKFIPNKFYPRWRWLAGITRASQARIYFTVANDFTAGEMITIKIPQSGANGYGGSAWSSINNKTVRVLSVTNSATESSVLVDLDTSGVASAFTYPLSANFGSVDSPAVVVPASSGVVPYNASATVPQEPPGTNLQDAFDNRNIRIIRFGTALFNQTGFTSRNGDYWMWQAFKYDSYRIDQ